MTDIWLYLHFPQLQLDSLLIQQVYTQDAPLVVIAPGKMQILQLNQTAYETGIRKHMSLGAAATLCPELQIQPYQEKVEIDKCTEIADRLYVITSDICFFDHSGLLLRAHTMLRLYGGLMPYWFAIQQQLSRLNVTYHYAAATAPLAAKILALEHWDQVTEQQEKIQKRLMNCLLPCTDLDEKTVHKLHRVGIRQLKQLTAIPLADIARRFSHELAQYLGQLSGSLPHPVKFYHPSPNFERYMELLYDINSTQTLIPPLCHLLNAMEQFLKLRDRLAMHIVMRLHQRDCAALDVHVGSQQGEYRVAAWQQLIELQLESVSLQAPVFGLTLSVNKSHLCVPDKPDLFDKQSAELSHLQLIAILQAKLGEQAVYSPAFNNEHIPEQANQTTQVFNVQKVNWNAYAMRPIFLLPQPSPLTCQISIRQSPERIQSGWWHNTQIERDYFVARSAQGQWLWVFRTPEQKWFVHGVFS